MEDQTAAISVALGPYMVEIIGVLWTIVMGFGGYWLKRMSDKLDVLLVHREECLNRFADRAANNSAHQKLFESRDNHEKRLTKVESDVENLKLTVRC